VSDASVLAEAERATPTRSELFLTFAKLGLCGFGGVGPWARRVIVEDKDWLDEREYAELLGLCQILPGPNVGNVSVCLGDRYHGPVGSLLALGGLLAGPMFVLLCLGIAYDHFGQLPLVHSAIGGIAAGAAGLFVGTALRMVERLRLNWIAVLIMCCAFVGIGIMQWPLVTVVLTLAPISLIISWREIA
jgi:chromate transporter